MESLRGAERRVVASVLLAGVFVGLLGLNALGIGATSSSTAVPAEDASAVPAESAGVVVEPGGSASAVGSGGYAVDPMSGALVGGSSFAEPALLVPGSLDAIDCCGDVTAPVPVPVPAPGVQVPQAPSVPGAPAVGVPAVPALPQGVSLDGLTGMIGG